MITFAFDLLLIALFVGFIIFKWRNFLVEHNIFEEFAEKNSCDYQETGQISDQSGVIFNSGNNRRFYDIVFGQIGQLPFSIFSYSYETGLDSNEKTHTYAIATIEFGYPAPNFMLHSHQFLEEVEQVGSSLGNNGNTEKISTDGEFDEHFETFIKPNAQIEVLSLLEPDVMAIFITLDKYEIEMTENGTLFIYNRGRINDKKEINNIYLAFKALAPKISRHKTIEQEAKSVDSQVNSGLESS